MLALFYRVCMQGEYVRASSYSQYAVLSLDDPNLRVHIYKNRRHANVNKSMFVYSVFHHLKMEHLGSSFYINFF